MNNTYSKGFEADKPVCSFKINKRKIGASIFLTIISLGIYSIYWQYLLIKNTKALVKDDSSCLREMLLIFFVPFYSLYWFYTRGDIVKGMVEWNGSKKAASGKELMIYRLLWLGFGLVPMLIMQNDFNYVATSEADEGKPNFFTKVAHAFCYTLCVKWIWTGFCVNILYKKFDKWKAWLYLAPALVLLLIFTVWPIINTVKMAFTVYWDPTAANDIDGDGIPDSYGAYKGYEFLLDNDNNDIDFEFGFDNFKTVINTDGFGRIMKNTVILCVATVPISTFLALLIAVCLNSIKPLRRFLQTIFFMPYVTNSIAIGMVFAAMFNIVGIRQNNLDASTSLGIINNALGLFGIDPVNWINQGSSYMANIAVMIIYIVWNALPFKILILLGGLQSVNKQYYDAAKIDATPRWRTFTRITVPLLSPMITYVVITGFIGGFKEYSSIVGIFGEAMEPPGASINTTVPRLQTMVGYINDSLKGGQGVASAAAIILFLIIFAVTLVNLAVSKRNTTYR